ncbi:MAG: peptidoglycan DD-metalloendopeptidase family protein [Desulfovibrio sp.]|nr:peptidoglycan DD-metalloendopeptidase family protein [Desulfovibrio sp.]
MKSRNLRFFIIAAGALICGLFLLTGAPEKKAEKESQSSGEKPAPEEIIADKADIPGVHFAADFCLNPPLGETSSSKNNTDNSAIALERGAAIAETAARALEKARKAVEDRSGFAAVKRGMFEKGDTLSKILKKAAGSNLRRYLKEVDKIVPSRLFRPGQPYVLYTDPETGRLKRFEYEINDYRKLVVEGGEKPDARLEDTDYEWRLEALGAVIDDNLFQTVANMGESPELVQKLVKLFGSEINFVKDIQAGDSFSALVEKRYRDGELKGYGRILAAKFTNKNNLSEAFLFYDQKDRPQYYNRAGENINKAFLRAPLSATRITSRFAETRFHPILRFPRPHYGVDYGAPVGTPVKCVGDGKITSMGWAGGYGNQVVVRHEGGVESMYSHLSAFPRGLKEGQPVSQGQVIGFVGSTGLSTGPHLDFRLKKGDAYLDPVKAINPRGAPVPDSKKGEFAKIRDRQEERLSGGANASGYTPDMIVPPTLFAGIEDEEIAVEAAPAPAPKFNRAYYRRLYGGRGPRYFRMRKFSPAYELGGLLPLPKSEIFAPEVKPEPAPTKGKTASKSKSKSGKRRTR